MRRLPPRLLALSLAATLLVPAGLAHAADAKDPGGFILLDGHADVLIPSTPSFYALPDGGSRVDLPHLTAGGMSAVVLSVAVASGPRDTAGFAASRREADEKLAKIKAFAASDPGRIALAYSAADVERLHRQGKIAVIIGFQNAQSIGRDVGQLRVFYENGARVFGLTHMGHNEFSDSSRPDDGAPVAEHHGLSPLGKQAVTLLNDLGGLIDVSQLSSDALSQTLALTRSPVVATHSDARAIVDHTRNLTDAELDAIAAKGGVVMLTPFTTYVHRFTAEDRARVSAVRQRHGLSADFVTAADGLSAIVADQQGAIVDELAKAQPKGSLEEYLDQIDYVAKRIGWDHVGIGSDFNHGSGVTGFDSAADAPNVTAGLIRRRYSQQQIAAIWGGNFLRVWRAAEANAKPGK